MQLNDVISRRRANEALATIAAMADADRADLATAGEALGALGATVKEGQRMLAAAASVPGVHAKIQPLLSKFQQNQSRLIAPLQRFGERATTRRQTCDSVGWAKGRGVVTAEERARTVPTKTPLFARLRFQQGELSKTFARTGVSNGVRVFNLGRQDGVGPYGYPDNPACTDFHTNLLEGGTMRPRSVFVGHGFAFLAENIDGTAVTRADLAVLGRGLNNWTEENDTHKIEHPAIGMCPMPNGIDEHGIAAGRTGARWVGDPYLSDEPLIRLRGAADGRPADKGHAMVLSWEDTTAELSADMYLYCFILGEHLQSPGGK